MKTPGLSDSNSMYFPLNNINSNRQAYDQLLIQTDVPASNKYITRDNFNTLKNIGRTYAKTFNIGTSLLTTPTTELNCTLPNYSNH